MYIFYKNVIKKKKRGEWWDYEKHLHDIERKKHGPPLAVTVDVHVWQHSPDLLDGRKKCIPHGPRIGRTRLSGAETDVVTRLRV